MIGALLMRMAMSRTQADAVSRRDLEALKEFWADDISLTFVGQPPIEGKDAVERWYRAWFDSIREIRASSTNFALVHPYAVGASNTVLFESQEEIEYVDGRRMTAREAAVIEIRRRKAVRIRAYVADEDGAKVLMGSRAG